MLVRRKWTDKERQYLTVDSLLQNRRFLEALASADVGTAGFFCDCLLSGRHLLE